MGNTKKFARGTKLVRANQQDIVVYMTDKGPQSNILYLFTSEGFKDINKIIQT